MPSHHPFLRRSTMNNVTTQYTQKTTHNTHMAVCSNLLTSSSPSGTAHTAKAARSSTSSPLCSHPNQWYCGAHNDCGSPLSHCKSTRDVWPACSLNTQPQPSGSFGHGWPPVNGCAARSVVSVSTDYLLQTACFSTQPRQCYRITSSCPATTWSYSANIKNNHFV